MGELTPDRAGEAPNSDQKNLEDRVDFEDRELGEEETGGITESFVVDYKNKEHGEEAKPCLTAYWPNSDGQVKAAVYRRSDGSGHVAGYDVEGRSLGTHFYEPNHGSAYWPEPWDEWVDAVIEEIGWSAQHRQKAGEDSPYRSAA